MKIVAAMSGGVDSSVVAGLLAEQGHEVVGVTLQLYDQGAAAGRKGACCAGRDIGDARDVADRLGITHYVIDAEARFRSAVIDDFADSYARGETPIPCVRCNQSVKFTDLLGLARDLGADAMATGHYVRRVAGATGAELHRARDDARDQSWFLFATTRDQLDYSRFPLGDMPDKATVRAEAARLGLPVAEKPDSQDICFVPGGHYTGLLATLRPRSLEAGEIVDRGGVVRGQHKGIAHYTVGQSKGLGTASILEGARQAVIALDPARNRITVGPRTAGKQTISMRQINWLVDMPEQFRCDVKLRAREVPHPATISSRGATATAELDTPAFAAPGQACVMYRGTQLVGGGFIGPA